MICYVCNFFVYLDTIRYYLNQRDFFFRNEGYPPIMKGAYKVETKSIFYTKFIKHGSEQDAMDDFWSTNPAVVNRSTLSKASVSIDIFVA